MNMRHKDQDCSSTRKSEEEASQTQNIRTHPGSTPTPFQHWLFLEGLHCSLAVSAKAPAGTTLPVANTPPLGEQSSEQLGCTVLSGRLSECQVLHWPDPSQGFRANAETSRVRLSFTGFDS